MIINLTHGYYVILDDLQYTLKQKYTYLAKDKKSEKIGDRTVSYHLTLGQAVEKYLRLLECTMPEDEAVTLRGYLALQEKRNIEAVRSITKAIEKNPTRGNRYVNT